MMGGGDKRKAIATILGPDPREEKVEPSGEDALYHCVNEFIEAVHAHDIAGATEALRSAVAEVKSEPQEE